MKDAKKAQSRDPRIVNSTDKREHNGPTKSTAEKIRGTKKNSDINKPKKEVKTKK